MSVKSHTAELLDRRLAVEQARRRLPSLVAGLVRAGELIWSAGAGRVDGAAPDADVQYRCGSITKTFVAVCVMRLRDEGRLTLEDPVERFLPGTGIGQVSVGQLLSHSGGLRAETGMAWWERTPGGDIDELAESTLHEGARFAAGRRFHYSNVGFGVLGAIVAALRGLAWDAVLTDELLAPLAMTRTTTRPAAPAAPGLAVHPFADVVLPEPEHDHGAMGPAGQLWTTVADLARWAAFLGGDGGELLSADTLAEMREVRVVVEDRDEAWTDGYGLGLQVYNDRGTRRIGHGGSMPGFLAGLELEPGGDGVVVMANATRGLGPELGEDLLAILAAHEPPAPPAWIPSPPPEGTLAALGTWYWGVAPYVLAARGDELELRVPAGSGRTSRFRQTAPDAFVGRDGYHTGEPLRLVRGADGAVSHLDLGSFIFTREPYGPAGPIPGGVDPDGWRA